MSVITSAARWVDDRLNPIVLRELRQAVRSRTVVAMLMVFLTVQLASVLIYVMVASDADRKLSLSAGSEITSALFAVLIFACMLFVPMYTGLRLAFERRDAQCDLMFITTISPGKTIRGKLFGAVMLTLLIYSACMPFLTFAYLMRGVDLPNLLLCLGIGFAIVIAASQVTILFACIPMSIVLRVIVSIGGVALMVWVATRMFVLYEEAQMIGLHMSSEFWVSLGVSLLTGVLGAGLLYYLSVALLSPVSANRTLPVRLYILGLWVVTLVVAIVLWLVYDQWGFIFGWSVLIIALLSLALIVAVSERQQWGPRVRRRIPKRSFRYVAFLFYSGAAGGVLWCVAMAALTLLIAYITYVPHRWGPDIENLHILSAIALYLYCYAMTSVLLWRLTMAKLVPHVFIWGICLLTACVIMLAPMLISFLFGSGWDVRFDAMDNPLMAITPMGLGYSDSSRIFCTGVAGAWAVLVTALNIPWIVAQYSRFRPLSDTASPEPGTDGLTRAREDAQ